MTDWPKADWETADGRVRLYRGDCLAILPTLPAASVDIVMTSPPYNTLPLSNRRIERLGMHGERRNGVNKWVSKAINGYADSRPESIYQAWLTHAVAECGRVSKGLVWVNHKVRYRDGEALHPVRFLPFPIYSEVIWNRRGSMALNCKRFAPSHECLLAFGTPHHWDDDGNKLLSVWDIPFDTDDNDHPCAFPLEIARRPIASSCPTDGTVLDPFAGSGTALIAAMQLKRCAVGIEQDERYFALAVKRIERALAEPDLFRESPPPPETADLFGGNP